MSAGLDSTKIDPVAILNAKKFNTGDTITINDGETPLVYSVISRDTQPPRKVFLRNLNRDDFAYLTIKNNKLYIEHVEDYDNRSDPIEIKDTVDVTYTDNVDDVPVKSPTHSFAGLPRKKYTKDQIRDAAGIDTFVNKFDRQITNQIVPKTSAIIKLKQKFGDQINQHVEKIANQIANGYIVTANCSFVTSYGSVIPFPASENLALYTILNKNVSVESLFGLFQKSITQIIKTIDFTSSTSNYVAAGLQEINNRQEVFDYLTTQPGVFLCNNVYDVYGKTYPALGYIVTKSIFDKLLTINIFDGTNIQTNIGIYTFVDLLNEPTYFKDEIIQVKTNLTNTTLYKIIIDLDKKYSRTATIEGNKKSPDEFVELDKNQNYKLKTENTPYIINQSLLYGSPMRRMTNDQILHRFDMIMNQCSDTPPSYIVDLITQISKLLTSEELLSEKMFEIYTLIQKLKPLVNDPNVCYNIPKYLFDVFSAIMKPVIDRINGTQSKCYTLTQQVSIANKMNIRDLGIIQKTNEYFLMKTDTSPDGGRPISMIVYPITDKVKIIHVNCHMVNPSVLKIYTQSDGNKFTLIPDPNDKTILQLGDTPIGSISATQLWINYCVTRMQETITEMLSDFNIESLDGTERWILTGDFNDAHGKLKTHLSNTGITVLENTILFHFGAEELKTCCPNTNSCNPQLDEDVTNNLSQYKMKKANPQDRIAANLSFKAIADENNKTLVDNFGKFIDPGAYAFQGDYVAISRNSGLTPTLTALQTQTSDLTSDHIFVKAVFTSSSTGGGIRRRRARRTMKRNKRTKKNHRKVSLPKSSHKRRLRNHRRTKK